MKNQKSEADFPIKGEMVEGKKTLNPDNYYKDHEIDLLRKKYLQFTVFFEALTEVLECRRDCSVEEFGSRIRDLVYAANQEEADAVQKGN